MSDAYGMLVFTKSKDCEFDGKKLKKILNHYAWNNDGASWEYDSKSKKLYFDLYQLQYPTVTPLETVSFRVADGSKSLKTILSGDMTEDDFYNIHDEEIAPVPLKKLCKEISQTLKSGWIEFSCSSNEKQSYVTFERMRIHSNGKATRQVFMSGTEDQAIEEIKLSKRELAILNS